MNNKTKDFIKKAILKHGTTFSYENVVYINNKTKISITCPEHGDFQQTPNCHLKGRACPQCWIKSKRDTPEQFIRKAQKVHKSTYTYQNSLYINNSTKVSITCQTHGDFEQYPSNHLAGNGCPHCKTNRLTTHDFILKAKQIHGDFYDYNEVNYSGNNQQKVTIVCPRHGAFQQTPRIHLSGCGCPNCRASKGERQIALFLSQNNINFETQKTFKGCKGTTSLLRFDFFLPDLNLCIEYDGQQHFKPVDIFGGKKTFTIQKKHDDIKNQFCCDHDISLTRIAYNEDIQHKLDFLKNEFILI